MTPTPSNASIQRPRFAPTKSLQSQHSDTIIADDDASVETVIKVEKDSDKDVRDRSISSIEKAFDHDLRRSRPYLRVSKRPVAESTTSSVKHTVGWSYFSGLSLADVSHISVLDLLISPNDIWNGEYYSAKPTVRTLAVPLWRIEASPETIGILLFGRKSFYRFKYIST